IHEVLRICPSRHLGAQDANRQDLEGTNPVQALAPPAIGVPVAGSEEVRRRSARAVPASCPWRGAAGCSIGSVIRAALPLSIAGVLRRAFSRRSTTVSADVG